MPKSYPHKGLVPVGGGGARRRLLELCKLVGDPVAEARARDRAVRAFLEAQPEFAVWVGARLYLLDNEDVLSAVAVGIGLKLPTGAKSVAAKKPAPAASGPAKTSRAKRAASSSSTEAAVRA